MTAGSIVTAGLADLHRHLDGSLRASTARELAGGRLPGDLAFHAGMGLEAALAKFEFTLSLLRTEDAVRRVANEICEDAAADGVTTLEIRFAPQLHRGAAIAAMEPVVDAAIDGASGRAGLILCGLYGEPVELVEALVTIAASRPGVVGIDLAGGPTPGAATLADYERPFRRAAELGIGRTVHAGEGRPPSEIRIAIERLGAQRIGHGTTLLDDPAVRDLLIERGVTVEACLTSNVHTGAVPSVEAHPLPRWLAAGVRACVCTDNTLLSATTSSREHALAASIPGMDAALLEQAIRHGHAARFAR